MEGGCVAQVRKSVLATWNTEKHNEGNVLRVQTARFWAQKREEGQDGGKSDDEWNETTLKTKKVVEPDAAILAGLLPAFVDCRFDNVITCATRQLLPSPESGSNLVTVSDRR